MNKLKIFNEFGINPTTNFTAAGLDFYIPDLTFKEPEKKKSIWKELAKSYKKDVEFLQELADKLVFEVTAECPELKPEFIYSNALNLLHLFCAIYRDGLVEAESNETIYEAEVPFFVEYVLAIPADETGKFGLRVSCGDSLFFNSGIRVALPHSHAGVFMNKSGRGLEGYDVRACVVDEDYTGLVHLSLHNDSNIERVIRIGDKLVQMLILPIALINGVENLTKKEYDELMKDAQRGTDGFGSSNDKK